MPPSQTPTVFYGPLVNPTSISSFQALPRCLLAVGASGDIDWIEQDVHASVLQAVLARHESLSVPLVVLKHGEFILPGFIDTHTVRTPSPRRATTGPSIYR
jgi:guanine deaminase